ncbi:MAG: MiaB/RimO family radical SAM methylthiotransferase [Candidatus Omnitrophica bacterium]|nr:MiaB/RimO family radical SAM methylthiotransferase [Candidatus Omnitrophota bacterium]
MKKIYIRTFGCQMNVRDSEALLGLFLEKGYAQAESEKDADVILLNTCSVRAHAEHRVHSILGSYKKLSAISRQPSAKKNKKAESLPKVRLKAESCKIIGLIGCMAKNVGEEVAKRFAHVDLIVAPSRLHKIPEYVQRIVDQRPKTKDQRPGLRIIDLEDGTREETFYSAEYRQDKSHAQVVISTGCANNCAYCVVPFVRGALRLRAPQDIIAEVKRNVAMGRTRITLLGQNVNDYNFIEAEQSGTKRGYTRNHPTSHVLRPTSFVDLLKMVEAIDGVEEIEFLTPHPKNTTRELFKLMAKSKKIKKYLHLPFQAGSDRILKLMNRGYTKKEYLELVKDYKEITGGTIGTDIIVGFPTETDEDFAHTKEILEKAQFMGAYIFKYSLRPHTQALKLKDDVPAAVKEKRHAILLDLQKKISAIEADKR